MRDKHAFTVGGFLMGLLVVTLVLAWATYGTLAGALGTLTYLLVGLLGLFPWIIPFVGIPLGILDLLGVFSVGVYDTTLRIARLDPSWLPALWYTAVAILASVVSLVVSVRAFQLQMCTWVLSVENLPSKPSPTHLLGNPLDQEDATLAI